MAMAFFLSFTRAAQAIYLPHHTTICPACPYHQLTGDQARPKTSRQVMQFSSSLAGQPGHSQNAPTAKWSQ
jgi:hypothetical protein